MPTEAEIFEKTHALLVRAYTQPCHCASFKAPGKCWSCQGSGIDLLKHAEECHACEGSGTCPTCGGSQTLVPDSLHPGLTTSMLVGWIRAMSLSRNQENFVRFSEQWDVLEEYVSRLMSLAREDSDPDEIRAGIERMFGPEGVAAVERASDSPNVGALSAEDLEALGIDG